MRTGRRGKEALQVRFPGATVAHNLDDALRALQAAVLRAEENGD